MLSCTCSSRGTLDEFGSYGSFSEPRLLFVLAVGVAKGCFQYGGFFSRANDLQRNDGQKYQQPFGFQEKKTDSRDHDASENVNRIANA